MNIHRMTSTSTKSNLFASDAEFNCEKIGGMHYSSHCPTNPHLCWHHTHALLFDLELHKSMCLTFKDKYDFMCQCNKDIKKDLDNRYYYYPHN